MQLQKTDVKELLASPTVKERFAEILGKRAATFTTSILQLVNSSTDLSQCEPMTVVSAAMQAATLNLPINANLGYAYVLPYNVKQPDGNYKKMAQFQMGYKGFIQLAQRSGQFTRINVSDVRRGELKKMDSLTGEIQIETIQNYTERKAADVIGYVAYFRLVNGFEKALYMSRAEAEAHGLKYSKTFAKGGGLWKELFDFMAQKTVLKMLLNRYAPLSVEMQTAVMADQSTITEEGTFQYVDNEPDAPENKELIRLKEVLQGFKKEDEVKDFMEKNGFNFDDDEMQLIEDYIENLKNKEAEQAATDAETERLLNQAKKQKNG